MNANADAHAATVERVRDVVAATSDEIRNGIGGRRGERDAVNPSGERQVAADAWADERLAERLIAVDGVAGYASEERDDLVGEADRDALHVCVDPLDGSSNLQSNNAVGTIFGVYTSPPPARGRDLVGAGYVLYGPLTTMVVAVGDTVTEYVVEDGAVHPVREDLTLPDEPVVYGFGGRVPDWPSEFREFAREIETELKLRYGGAFVGDVNQVLSYGGVFAYPALRSRPEGKLRLQFEGNPIAYVVEAAGGRSSDGERSLLDVEAEEIHQRVPVHVGNADLIDRLETRLTT